jgi:hypothetical protein
MGIQRSTTEYNGVQQGVRESELRQLTVGDSYGKLLAKEKLEVSL